MRNFLWISIGFLAFLASGSARAGGAETPGSSLDIPSGNRFQSRIVVESDHSHTSLNASNSSLVSPRQSSVSLIGNYYLRPALSQLSFSGLRATGGLILGRGASPFGGLGSGNLARPSAGFSASSMRTEALASEGNYGNNASYVGIGYTGVGLKRSWGFSADLGLMSLSPGSAVGLGRVVNGGQNLDDMVREMRLSPVVQLGISYSF